MIKDQEELLTNAINSITEKLSELLLSELLKLPDELQTGFVLEKVGQLLLSNILCQIASTKTDLDKIASKQGEEIVELTANCAYVGFSDKFEIPKH